MRNSYNRRQGASASAAPTSVPVVKPSQPRNEFTPATLLAAADALAEKAIADGTITPIVSIELRALAAHLRSLSRIGGAH